MRRSLASSLLLAGLVAAPVLQAQTGNIDPAQRHVWAENAGWLDFRPAYGGVTVLPTFLTGYAWHENAGWVKLGVDAGGPYTNGDSPTTWGVNLNSITGALSGFAWSENAGWIRMDPAFGGVVYSSLTHQMSGWAWSENLGWLHFRSILPIPYGVAVTCGNITGTVIGGGTACAGSSSTFTVSVIVSGGTAPYTVTLDNGGGTQSDVGPIFTFPVNPSATTTYSVSSLTDALLCAGSGSGSATVTVNPIPAAPTPTNDGPKCEGGDVQLTVPYVNGATWAWTGPNGFTSSEMLPMLSNVIPAMAGDYSVTVKVGGCTSTPGTTAVVVNPKPVTPVITAPANAGPGQSFAASVPDVAGMTYAWSVTNGALTAGTGTHQIIVLTGETGPVTISVIETNTATTCSSAEATVSIPVGLLATGFYTATPCRLFDTRESTGPSAASPALAPEETRTFTVGTRCGLTSSMIRSLSVNQTVTAPTADGEIVLYRGDMPSQPITSNLSYRTGKTRANNSILELSRVGDGTFKIHNRSTGSVHFILDVNGWFQ